MPADIIFDGENLQLKGIIDAKNSTATLFEAKATHFVATGIMGDYGTYDHSTGSFCRIFSADDRVFITRHPKDSTTVVSDVLIVENNNVFVCRHNELTSKGELAGFAFYDRTHQDHRYVLYAYEDKIRFYKDGIGDVLTIDDTKTLNVQNVTTEKIETKSLLLKYQQSDGHGYSGGSLGRPQMIELDVLKTIQDLQKRIAHLESQIATGKTV